MKKYLDFIKKHESISDIDNESEKENIEPSVYSVDSLNKEFFNENSPKVSVDLTDKEKIYINSLEKYKSYSDIDINSESEQENIEPSIYSVDSLSKEFFNENSSNLRKRKVYFREFKINQDKEKETVNQSINSKVHIPTQNKVIPYFPLYIPYSQNNFPIVNGIGNILPVNRVPIIENYSISMQNPASEHIKLTNLYEKKVDEENVNNEKVEDKKVEDEKIEEEKVEDKLLTRLIKSLKNYVNFTN